MKSQNKKTQQPENTTTVLATTGSSVFTGLDKVKEKLAALKHVADSVYVTPGRITLSTGVVNIKDLRKKEDITSLVTALANVIVKASAMQQAYDALNITNHPVIKVDGGTVEEWTKDVNLQIAIINNHETVQKLQKIEEGLKELMDKNDRAALLMADLENI